MTRGLVVLVGMLALAPHAEARVERLVKVAYLVGNKPSGIERQPVTFVLGSEINASLGAEKYKPRAVYALIQFRGTDKAVVRLTDPGDAYFYFGPEKTELEGADFKDLFAHVESRMGDEVGGKGERKWMIWARDEKGWIDPGVK